IPSSSSSSFLFFFYESPAHPHLHSFPTRRSSDLAAIDAVLAKDPGAATNIADQWLTLALYERNPAEARRALTALPPEGCRNETRSEEHTSELQSRGHLVCRLLLEKKKHI